MGSITVPVVYSIMRESGYPVGVALFSACLILFGKPGDWISQQSDTSADLSSSKIMVMLLKQD